jgi:hypothetical protein
MRIVAVLVIVAVIVAVAFLLGSRNHSGDAPVQGGMGGMTVAIIQR